MAVDLIGAVHNAHEQRRVANEVRSFRKPEIPVSTLSLVACFRNAGKLYNLATRWWRWRWWRCRWILAGGRRLPNALPARVEHVLPQEALRAVLCWLVDLPRNRHPSGAKRWLFPESCLFRYTSHKKPPFDDIAKTPRVP